MLFKDLKIPDNSILGINYSGMHDTSVAIIDENGRPIFASALERFSRYKQDGRPPLKFFEEMPWDKIKNVAISTEETFTEPKNYFSDFLEVKIPKRKFDNSHKKKFNEVLDLIPSKKTYICHQIAHASSAFWHSPFENSLCLTYDGGMLNSPWFGGLYEANKKNGITNIENFSSYHYAKITSLYTFITAILGFTPMRHEGKITGLAALGEPNKEIISILKKWFENEFLEIEKCINWNFIYSDTTPPIFLINEAEIKRFKDQLDHFTKEDIAASIQKYTEDHILKILMKVNQKNIKSKNICLAGGLFANVKLNQKIYESSFFENVFIAPAMTDDGTALGAAWHLIENKKELKNKLKYVSMYLGKKEPIQKIREILKNKKIEFIKTAKPEIKIASLLSKGKIVAIFQGAMEFGPRALGNRSILAQATEFTINSKLNKKLNRTEFMPFAPITRLEDASKYYKNITGVKKTLSYMTITLSCTNEMIKTCPAVVHVDGTARPQLVSKKNNLLMYNILTEYSTLTKIFSLVNTSFNTHEEPIVCTLEDALSALFTSGIDYLYVEGGFLIELKENKNIGYEYLKEQKSKNDYSVKNLELINLYSYKNKALRSEVESKETELNDYRKELIAKERVINQLSDYLKINVKDGFHSEPLLIKSKSVFFYRLGVAFRQIFLPKLGVLNQYYPRDLVINNKQNNLSLTKKPKISIVVPSFNQGTFVKRTIDSILDQNYKNKEVIIVDGNSTDNTLEVLKTFKNKIKWISEKDNGQADAINKGFKNCTGDIMAWINSDDIYFPNTFENVIKYFQNNPDVDIIYGNRIIINEFDKDVGRWVLPEHDNNVLNWVDFIPQETMFWRRKIWKKAGKKLDVSFKFALDWELILRFKSVNGNFLHIPFFLGGFRVHRNQKTNVDINSIGVKEMNILRTRALGFVPNKKQIKNNIFFYLTKHLIEHIKYLFYKKFQK